MNSVMLSIRPKWCELIASGKKTIEVRRTKANIQTPFKCYIYETQGRYDDMKERKTFRFWESRQKVIGEFACVCVDKIEVITAITTDYVQVNGKRSGTITRDTCLSIDELQNYGDWKPVYGWHISDLKIYDKPRELSEFLHRKKYDWWDYGCNTNKPQYEWKSIERPPRSWCYVRN